MKNIIFGILVIVVICEWIYDKKERKIKRYNYVKMGILMSCIIYETFTSTLGVSGALFYIVIGILGMMGAVKLNFL
ncbi:MAG: hypothetical protein ACRDAU_16550 [Clostridium sp.]